MKKKLPKIHCGWILAALCFLLAFLLYTGVPGYSFSALIFCGIGALLICYRLLALLKVRHPGPAKAMRMILTGCLCAGILAAAVTGVIIFRGSLGHPEQDCDYVIVLGAGVNGTVPSLSLRERINGAYDYLAAHPDAICVVSGGQGNGELISEARCMYNELVEMGIDGSRIWLEDQATNTRENIRFSLDIIAERTGTRPAEIGLVSSEYHLYRAGLFAADEGVAAVGIPATTSWITLRANYFLREIAAVWYYALLGR